MKVLFFKGIQGEVIPRTNCFLQILNVNFMMGWNMWRLSWWLHAHMGELVALALHTGFSLFFFFYSFLQHFGSSPSLTDLLSPQVAHQRNWWETSKRCRQRKLFMSKQSQVSMSHSPLIQTTDQCPLLERQIMSHLLMLYNSLQKRQYP